MNVYIYDKTFDGLLTAVFDAYFRKTFPDFLLSDGDALPLFYDELHTVVTDEEKAARVWRGLQKVDGERMHLMQFVRFQKAADGTFFAAFEPQYNALPLTVQHFKDRFADQKWIIYDMKRRYGFYYDLQEVTTISFDDDSREAHLITGMLDESLMDENEKIFQKLWKTYFKAICIKERMNPRKHKKDMPVRYWKYLTEKQK